MRRKMLLRSISSLTFWVFIFPITLALPLALPSSSTPQTNKTPRGLFTLPNGRTAFIATEDGASPKIIMVDPKSTEARIMEIRRNNPEAVLVNEVTSEVVGGGASSSGGGFWDAPIEIGRGLW